MVTPLLGLIQDLHPLDNAHAEHTIKSLTDKFQSGSI